MRIKTGVILQVFAVLMLVKDIGGKHVCLSKIVIEFQLQDSGVVNEKNVVELAYCRKRSVFTILCY